MRSSVVYVFTALLTAALCVRLYTRGGPYFQRPITVFQHVGPEHHDIDDAIVLCQRAAPMLPRRATVTCFRPLNGEQQFDSGSFLTAAGMLPKQIVRPPQEASLLTPRDGLCQYVIAVRDPFTHPQYEQIAEWPEGRLYKVR